MKKSDLKNGMIVELRNGERYIKIDDGILEHAIGLSNGTGHFYGNRYGTVYKTNRNVFYSTE